MSESNAATSHTVATGTQAQVFGCGHVLHSINGDVLAATCPVCFQSPSMQGWRWPDRMPKLDAETLAKVLGAK